MRRRTKAILITAGILATLSVLSGVAIATVSLAAWPSVSGTIPDKVSEIQIRAKDNVLLSAWLFQPDHPNGATVIALHGHRDTRRGVTGVARFLRDAGYQVIAPDSRGHGKSGAIGLRSESSNRRMFILGPTGCMRRITTRVFMASMLLWSRGDPPVAPEGATFASGCSGLFVPGVS